MWSAIEGDLKADVSALPKFEMVHFSDLVSAVVRRGGLQWGQWRQAMECVQGQDYRVQYSYHRYASVQPSSHFALSEAFAGRNVL